MTQVDLQPSATSAPLPVVPSRRRARISAWTAYPARVRARIRRTVRRILWRYLPVLAIVGIAVGAVVYVLGSGRTLAPDEIGASVHDAVLRDVVERTGDYSMKVGRLDCIKLGPATGTCLANTTSDRHQVDGLLVAVSYRIGPGGQINWKAQLP